VIYLNWPTLLVQNSKSLAVIIKLTITINSYYYLQQFYIFIFFGQGNSFIFYSGQNQLVSDLITNWNTFYKSEYFFSKVFRYILAKCNISEQFSKIFWYILTRRKNRNTFFGKAQKTGNFFQSVPVNLTNRRKSYRNNVIERVIVLSEKLQNDKVKNIKNSNSR
jgi:hypothetical protein